MKVYIALFSFFLLACDQKVTKKTIQCNELTGIDDSLYNAILKYQKANPIPNKININNLDRPPPIQASFKYIYEVRFIQNQDTLITIKLRLDGVQIFKSNSKTEVYGVYQDSCLKPTYFVFDKSLKMDFLKIFKKDSLENFYYGRGTNIDFFYDMDVYKIKGKGLIFEEQVKGSTR